METNQFIKATVGIVVVFLVIIAVAIPIIGGFTESSPGETGTNTGISDPEWGIYGMEDGTTITKASTNGDILINGTAQPMTLDLYLFTESYCLRLTDGGDFYLQYGGSPLTANIIRSVNLSMQGDILAGTIDILSTGDEDVPTTLSDKLNFVLSNDAESYMTDIGYVPVNAGSTELNPFYVNSNSEIIGIFEEVYPNGLYIGSYDSLQTLYIPNSSQMPPTMSLTIGTSDRDATQITGFTTDPDLGDDELYLFVPAEYYIMPVEPQVSGPVADMVNLVPLLLVVGLIIAAVAAFITLKSRGGGA